MRTNTYGGENEKVNDQKLTNFILILTTTITAISILLFWKQLEEQRLNRLDSVLPDIFPQDFVTSLEECNHELNASKGIHIYPQQNMPSKINLVNIGIGSAKQIETQWLYKISEVDDLIKNVYSFFSRMNPSDSDYVSFLKPKKKAKICLPFYYILCCGERLNLKSGNSGGDGEFGEKPKLKLHISYLDINKRKFERRFDVIVSAYSQQLFLKFKLLE